MTDTLRVFSYNGNTYTILENLSDQSTNGCVYEIVTNDEYKLSRFQNITNTFLIDIGANCGVATIILAKQNPHCTVLSFEPDKTVFEVLKTNVKLNNLENVKLFNKAVSKKGVSELELIHHPLYSGGNTTYSNKDAAKNYFKKDDLLSYTIPCISLDEIIEEFSIDSIPILKIDCEGAEYDILYESNYFKQNYVGSLVGEFHYLPYNTFSQSSPQGLYDYCSKFVKDQTITFLYL